MNGTGPNRVHSDFQREFFNEQLHMQISFDVILFLSTFHAPHCEQPAFRVHVVASGARRCTAAGWVCVGEEGRAKERRSERKKSTHKHLIAATRISKNICSGFLKNHIKNSCTRNSRSPSPFYCFLVSNARACSRFPTFHFYLVLLVIN